MTERFSPLSYEVDVNSDLEEKLMFKKPDGKYMLYEKHHMTVLLYNKARDKNKVLEEKVETLEEKIRILENQLAAYNIQDKKAS
jgi:hypothetical protein